MVESLEMTVERLRERLEQALMMIAGMREEQERLRGENKELAWKAARQALEIQQLRAQLDSRSPAT